MPRTGNVNSNVSFTLPFVVWIVLEEDCNPGSLTAIIMGFLKKLQVLEEQKIEGDCRRNGDLRPDED
jgi:hypothetical protein